MMKVCFISRNKFKIKEVEKLLSGINVELIPIEHTIEELQTDDVRILLKHKILSAFKYVGRPVFVEHTGLYLEGLNGLPGGLTQVFWDKLEAELFSGLFCNLSPKKVIAKTDIAFCDGKKLFSFHGEIAGILADSPCGCKDFQWDCIFIPDGYDKTFAELGDEKNSISMRKLAFDEFKSFLAKRGV